VESLARGKDLADPVAPDLIKLHTRIAAELGADVIKTEYTGDPNSMAEVVQACPLPIMVLGGQRKQTDEAVLQMLKGVVLSGAKGVFFGRNVFQAPDITLFLKQARSILDEDTSKVWNELAMTH
jgi:fructose-bisphosphate aldolase/2-amino-3,7-dideoxy-D-threo-hept-6-ulosonate synthase